MSYWDTFPVQLTNPSVEFASIPIASLSRHRLEISAKCMTEIAVRKKDGTVRPFSKPTVESKAI